MCEPRTVSMQKTPAMWRLPNFWVQLETVSKIRKNIELESVQNMVLRVISFEFIRVI